MDNFNFNLNKTAIYQSIKYAKNPVFRFAKTLNKIFLIITIFSLLGFLSSFFWGKEESILIQSLFSLAFLSLSIALFFWLTNTFFESKLKNPKLKNTLEDAFSDPEKYNIAGLLSFESAKAVRKAIILAKKEKLPEITSSLLFYSLLTENTNLNFVFNRVLINPNEITKVMAEQFKLFKLKDVGKEIDFSEDFKETILESLKLAKEKNHQRIEKGDILTTLADHDPFFKEVLVNVGLKAEDINNLCRWLEYLEKRIEERKKFWDRKSLIKMGSLGKEWASGYSITLDRFSTDMSKMLQQEGYPRIIGHDKEVEEMERMLSGSENNNVMIVGESGTGRKSIVWNFAIKSALGQSFPEINFRRVVQLDLSSLISQIQNINEAEWLLDKIFHEILSAGNIILVIDEMHNFVSVKDKPGTIDISGIIMPYLKIPQFRCIAIVTYEGLHKNIEQNKSFLSLFERVEVPEMSEKDCLVVLEDKARWFEVKYNKFISYQALRDIVNYCAKYMPANPFPEKALKMLDEVIVSIVQSREKVLLPKHVAKIVSEKTQIPVGELEIKEKETLLNLESLIHQRIINQEEAVKEVSAALRRARAEVTIRKGPMGCFLFLGPTGVGKTETSKALAEIYFGSEDRMIRLDMSEFQTISDIPRLLGSPGEEGLLTTKVRETPFSLLLLDEIEKAHPNILNLFLQVLDEGFLTDGLGRKVDFKNTIIIATSNAGYQVILEAIKKSTEWEKVKQTLLDYIFAQGIFRPEFVNRFDAFVVFKPLTKENLLEIAELLLQKLKKNLKEKGIEFLITQELKEKIVELGYDPTFGARQMRRVIQDKVENVFASALLAGQLKRGYKVEIDPSNFTLSINP